MNTEILKSFEELTVQSSIKRAIEKMGFVSPTPIQALVIPHLLNGEDVLAKAPTGTGKTCAFGIPLVEKIDKSNTNVQVLILCPTRELAMQTTEEIHKLTFYTESVKVVPIYGGQSFARQLVALKKKPQIVVGTPGRVIDHLDRKTLRIEDLKMLVLDEADEMLNMGFREDIDTILKNANSERQTALFSATMPKEIVEISKSYQKNPVSVEVPSEKISLPKIDQIFVELSESEKVSFLKEYMAKNNITLALAFCNTKKRTDELAKILIKNGVNACALHGDLRQRERDNIMKDYRTGKLQLLVATDVAARGIDVKDIQAIFNFDLPKDLEYYVHRIGRTGRANKTGVAISLVSSRQMPAIGTFEKETNAKISILSKGEYLKESSVDNRLELKSSLGLHSEFIAKGCLKNDNASRFFINVGKRDNLTEKSFEEMLLNVCKLTNDEIVEIKLLDTFSFVETKKGSEGKILTLAGKEVNNRKINVEKSDMKSKRSSGNNSSRKFESGSKREFGARSSFKGSSFGNIDRKPFAPRKPRNENFEHKDESFDKSSLSGSEETKSESKRNFAPRTESFEAKKTYAKKNYSSSFGDSKRTYGHRDESTGFGSRDRKPYAPRKPRSESFEHSENGFKPNLNGSEGTKSESGSKRKFGERKSFKSSSFGNRDRKPFAPRTPRSEGFERKEGSSRFGDSKKTFGHRDEKSSFNKKSFSQNERKPYSRPRTPRAGQ
ncbi:MAG: DEAD/DEAH box helicase [Clostridia bacterium]